MKKVFLTMGLAAITAIGWGQHTIGAYPRDVNPLLKLQHGSRSLVISDNHFLTGVGFSLASAGFYTIGIRNSQGYSRHGYDGGAAKVVGGLCGITSLGFFVSSYVNKRIGLERIYFGINGIKINLR